VLYVGDECKLPLLPHCLRHRDSAESADERPVVREDGKAVPLQHISKMANGEVPGTLLVAPCRTGCTVAEGSQASKRRIPAAATVDQAAAVAALCRHDWLKHLSQATDRCRWLVSRGNMCSRGPPLPLKCGLHGSCPLQWLFAALATAEGVRQGADDGSGTFHKLPVDL
jgi:hypothetical protein